MSLVQRLKFCSKRRNQFYSGDILKEKVTICLTEDPLQSCINGRCWNYENFVKLTFLLCLCIWTAVHYISRVYIVVSSVSLRFAAMNMKVNRWKLLFISCIIAWIILNETKIEKYSFIHTVLWRFSYIQTIQWYNFSKKLQYGFFWR